MKHWIQSSIVMLAVLPLGMSAFGAKSPSQQTEDLSWGEVGLVLVAKPAEIHPAGSMELTLTLDTPEHLQATLPDLRTRLQGFASAESLVSDPTLEEGRKRSVQRWILTPAPAAEEYRLAPFAVEVRDTSTRPPAVSWFATRPIVFHAADPGVPPEGDPEVTPRPDWIRPTARTIATWIGFAVLGAALLAGLVRAAAHVRRKVVERSLSPRDRALAELARLIRRDLVGKGLYKDFYVELTRVVRRYIERAHGIRAAEQTTEEFLAAATGRPEFAGEVLARLRAFLESADLVKFAGVSASPRMAAEAIDTAKTYVERDAAIQARNTGAAAEKTTSRP
ncbi:MAG: hypothetical protein ACOX5G_08925 [Kiritimatiellia bacterium]